MRLEETKDYKYFRRISEPEVWYCWNDLGKFSEVGVTLGNKGESPDKWTHVWHFCCKFTQEMLTATDWEGWNPQPEPVYHQVSEKQIWAAYKEALIFQGAAFPEYDEFCRRFWNALGLAIPEGLKGK